MLFFIIFEFVFDFECFQSKLIYEYITIILWDSESSIDTTDTMQTETILSQISYVKAFDEVIRKQIL